ncbi:hypothetical protein EOI86_06800 [Hwanghaeella grinnelliae]|uniref:Uncharacterized protein n=1 Tax=Hwanghaeella grinnelliae TaxID=2500179 RepID=A0A3S2Y5E8_9PROT|nr:hypothetical protein [Hwanghaeella grinnelliae]RVU38966.1 hypothetical protein EOI86_06800 [Hwanghaeella grinnelliae]
MPHRDDTPQPANNLPELLEAEAPASVRAVYDGLRQGAATPIAALIWRHIATHPGLLEACWTALGPLFADGRLPDAAWRVAKAESPRKLLPKVAPRARSLLGIAPEDAETIQALAEAYNRANPVNMLGVKVLLARLDSDQPREAAPAAAADWSPPPAIARAIPPMTAPADMEPSVRYLLNDLRFGDTDQLDPVVPSLYRHLTNWPAYLAVLHVGLEPLFRDGTMTAAVTRVEQAMDEEAARLARLIDPVPDLAGQTALLETMRRFAGGVIPMMIITGRAIADQLE